MTATAASSISLTLLPTKPAQPHHQHRPWLRIKLAQFHQQAPHQSHPSHKPLFLSVNVTTFKPTRFSFNLYHRCTPNQNSFIIGRHSQNPSVLHQRISVFHPSSHPAHTTTTLFLTSLPDNSLHSYSPLSLHHLSQIYPSESCRHSLALKLRRRYYRLLSVAIPATLSIPIILQKIEARSLPCPYSRKHSSSA